MLAKPLSALFLVTFAAQAEDLTGRVYRLAKPHEQLFVQKIHLEDAKKDVELRGPASGLPITSEKRLTTITHDMNGKMIMRLRASYSGLHLISQEIENFQTHEAYSAETTEDTITFHKYTMNEKHEKKEVSTKTERVRDGFISGPLAQDFVKAHWRELMKGRWVKTRFSVFERSETFGFAFKKKKFDTLNGKEILVLDMRPSSFVVAMLVPAIELSVDTTTQRLVRYRGPTPFQVPDANGKLKPLQAEILYD